MQIVVKNLKEAILGESNARRRYELFSEQAKRENLNEIARYFKSISLAEGIHVKNHLKALSVITNSEVDIKDFVEIDEEELKTQVKDTRSNLTEAIKGETYETKEMYKKFLKNSRKEGSDVAELSFSLARKAEKVHAKIYSNLLKKLEKNEKFEYIEIYVCTICGNVELGTAPKICPICDHDQKFFKEVQQLKEI